MNLCQVKTNIDISITLILILTLALVFMPMFMPDPFSLDISTVMFPLMLIVILLVNTRLNRLSYEVRWRRS